MAQELEAEQKKLQKISKNAYEEFDSAAKSVEGKFKPAGIRPVCSSLQSSLIECYQQNPGKPMQCSEELSSLKACVAAVRQDFMTGKSDESSK